MYIQPKTKDGQTFTELLHQKMSAGLPCMKKNPEKGKKINAKCKIYAAQSFQGRI